MSKVSRIPRLTAETAPEGSREFVAKAIAGNGFLPNLVATLAHAPTALEAYVKVTEINARTSLTIAERETVQIAAARSNGCDFCVAGHSKLALKKAELPPATVAKLQIGELTGDARLDALQRFTSRLIEHRGAVPDGELDAFLGAGFSHQQALEVVLGVSLSALCNYANVLAANELNPELRAFGRGAVA